MRLCASVLLILCVLALAGAGWADGPVTSAEGKSFGPVFVPGEDGKPDPALFFDLFEKSKASIAFITVSWADCQPTDSGSGASQYDFSTFDSQVFMKSVKPKMVWVNLDSPWTDEVKTKDEARYWKLVEDFVAAFAKHAETKGVKYFHAPGYEMDALGRPDWAQLQVGTLKHFHKAVKAANASNIVVVGGFSNGEDGVIQAFYDAGAKDFFDVLDIHAQSDDPKQGLDIFQVVSAHRAMARNGDGEKQIFIGAGWGPGGPVPGASRVSAEAPVTEAEIAAIKAFVENGYRNILTDRDIYSPDWVLGAAYASLNDFYVSDSFINSGLASFDGSQKNALIDNFPPKIPLVQMEANIVTDGPVFNYVTGHSYNVALKVFNYSTNPMTLDGFNIRWHSDKSMALTVVSDSKVSGTLEPGKDATANLQVTFPDEAAGRQVTLIGTLDYTMEGVSHTTDCWLTVMVASKLEVTLLPSRATLNPVDRNKRIGMSVINHADSEFTGKIKLTASQGLTVEPSEIDTTIDSHGLEAFVFMVAADQGAAPGHYAVYVDVGGQVNEWAAVEVPLVVKKSAGKITVDGKLDDWKDASAVTIAKATKNPDGKWTYDNIGRGMFSYDDSNFYMVFTIDDDKHVPSADPAVLDRSDAVVVGFDTLLNGARIQSGGYKEDDYEYVFADTKTGPAVARYQAAGDKPIGEVKAVGFVFKQDGKAAIYEMAVPWSELSPFAPKPGEKDNGTFGMAVLVSDDDGSGRSVVEWGGGLEGNKDPRKFIPVVLN